MNIIKCDACGMDLTETGNIVDYRLRLSSERKQALSAGTVTDIMISPDITRDHHFCGPRCLKQWMRSRG